MTSCKRGNSTSGRGAKFSAFQVGQGIQYYSDKICFTKKIKIHEFNSGITNPLNFENEVIISLGHRRVSNPLLTNQLNHSKQIWERDFISVEYVVL